MKTKRLKYAMIGGAKGSFIGPIHRMAIRLDDLADLAAVNEVYADRFPKPARTRSVVGVSALPLGALIEMDCIACR